MALSKDQILSARDFKTKEVPVPEWGGDILVRSLDGAGRDKIEAAFLSKETEGLKAMVVALTVCDENGKLLFEQADVERLQAKSAEVLERVFEAAWEISGLRAGSIEAAEGN